MGAIALKLSRHWWGSQWWFPISVGLVATLAIIPLTTLLAGSLSQRSSGHRGRFIFFMFCSIFPLAGVPFLEHGDWLLICGLFVMSLIFLWGAIGTLFHWPGFRDQQYEQDVDDSEQSR